MRNYVMHVMGMFPNWVPVSPFFFSPNQPRHETKREDFDITDAQRDHLQNWGHELLHKAGWAWR